MIAALFLVALVLALPVAGDAGPHTIPVTSQLERDFLCIYSHENGGYGWTADTGNGYHGGLQFDSEFERTYGAVYRRAWGHASRWPASVQLAVAMSAYLSGRGFAPWPNTARACGLIR